MTDHAPKEEILPPPPPMIAPKEKLEVDINHSDEDIKSRQKLLEKKSESSDLSSNKSEISPGSRNRMGATPTIIVDNDLCDADDDSCNHK